MTHEVLQQEVLQSSIAAPQAMVTSRSAKVVGRGKRTSGTLQSTLAETREGTDTFDGPKVSSLARATKRAGTDAWSGFKTALQLLNQSSDVFPPLKSAITGFQGAVDVFEASGRTSPAVI